MTSFDTNLLLYSLNKDCVEYEPARAFFAALPTRPAAVAVCELVLLELYVLLRNPAVVRKPLASAEAVGLVQTFRRHPAWRLIDYPGDASAVMNALWQRASDPTIGPASGLRCPAGADAAPPRGDRFCDSQHQ